MNNKSIFGPLNFLSVRNPPTFAGTFVSLSSARPHKRPDAGRLGRQSGASWGCLPTIRAPES
jgi:hypothetical protein